MCSDLDLIVVTRNVAVIVCVQRDIQVNDGFVNCIYIVQCSTCCNRIFLNSIKM